MKQIVLVGSMGGTNPNHPLNSLGNGNILVSVILSCSCKVASLLWHIRLNFVLEFTSDFIVCP